MVEAAEFEAWLSLASSFYTWQDKEGAKEREREREKAEKMSFVENVKQVEKKETQHKQQILSTLSNSRPLSQNGLLQRIITTFACLATVRLSS